MIRALLALVAPLVLLSTLPRTTTAAPAQDDAMPTGREVVDRFLKEAGVAEVWPTLKSIEMRGKLEVVGTTFAGGIETLRLRPGSQIVRGDLSGFGSFEYGFDGSLGWMLHPMSGPSLASGFKLAQQATFADFRLATYDAELFDKLENTGRKTFEGTECFEVRMLWKPFRSDDPKVADEKRSLPYRDVREYFDVKTGLLHGRVIMEETALGPGKVTTVYSDYKAFGDMKVATVRTQSTASQSMRTRIEEVVFDELDESELARPDDIEALVENERQRTGEAK